MNTWLNKKLNKSTESIENFQQGGNGVLKLRKGALNLTTKITPTLSGYAKRKRPLAKILTGIIFIALFLVVFMMVPPLMNGKSFSEFAGDFHYFGDFSPIILDTGGVIIEQTIGDTLLKLGRGILQSISWAVTGVFLAILMAVPTAFIASRNVINNKAVNQSTRWIMTFIRALPILIVGLILTRVFYNDLTVIMIMTLLTFPTLTKWLYEDLDDIDQNFIKSLKVLGFSKTKIIKEAIIPKISKRLLSSSFYLFETAFRFSAFVATIEVGMGGLGVVFGQGGLDFNQATHYGHIFLSVLTIAAVLTSFSFVNKIIERYLINYKTKRIFVETQPTFEKVSGVKGMMKKAPKVHKLAGGALALGGIAIVAVSLAKIDGWGTKPNLEQVGNDISILFEPDWTIMAGSTWGQASNPLYSLINGTFIVLGGVLFGIIFGVTLGILAVKKVSGTVTSFFVTALITFLRAIPSYIFTLFFFSFSPANTGAFGALIALSITSTSAIAARVKMAASTVEEDFGKTIKVNGGTRFDFIRYALLPKLKPEIISRSAYQFEVGLKTLIVLGAFGVGDFGYNFNAIANAGQYDQLMVYIILFTSVLIIVEIINNYIRQRVKSGTPPSKFQFNWLPIFIIDMRIRKNMFFMKYFYFRRESLIHEIEDVNYKLTKLSSKFISQRIKFNKLRELKILNKLQGVKND